jgi:LytS/YehU family sensor histidine kinase
MLESGRTALFSLVYCFKESIVLLAIAALSLALKSTSRWFNSESERQQMKKEHLESELNNLKSQINPHFLFNTLNNIYSLTITNTDKAQYSIKELSNMLRYVLYESNQIVVPLRKELDFIRNFINLMTLRLSENVKLTVDIRQQVEPNIMIAPLLFIALVENAFKHGLKSAHNSFIDIKIKIENNYIVCFVANSNYPTNNENKVDSGVGLDNLNKRLKLLYPSGYSFIIEDKENVYSSTLKIRLSN